MTHLDHAPTTHPEHGDVVALLNVAADDVLDAVGAADTGTRDVVNLLVNLFALRVDQPTATLLDAAEQYDTPSTEQQWESHYRAARAHVWAVARTSPAEQDREVDTARRQAALDEIVTWCQQ